MDSQLVLLLTQARSEFPLNEIFARLSKENLVVEALIDDNGVQRSEDFYKKHAGEFLEEAKILVAGIGIPVKELVSVAPNLDMIVTIDPDYNRMTSLNGGQRAVNVRYLENPPNRFLELGTNITKVVQDYLAHKNYESTVINQNR